MGAFCNTSKENTVQFSASFSTDLKVLYQKYKRIVLYLRQSKLFASEDKLRPLVHAYLTDPISLNKDQDILLAIDSSHKLHPLEYGSNQKVTLEWLTQACLRQNKFVIDFPVEMLSYQSCYKHYVQFLYLCSKRPSQVIVPNKMADFIWHAHMLDNQAYKVDMLMMLKRILNHKDDYDQKQLNQHTKRTEQIRQMLLPLRKGQMVNKNVGYTYIYYGNGVCGGAVEPHRQEKHHHDDIHHKQSRNHHTTDKQKRQEEHGTIDINHHHHHSDNNNYHHHHQHHHHQVNHHQVHHHDVGGNDNGGGNAGCGGGGGGDAGCGGGGGCGAAD